MSHLDKSSRSDPQLLIHIIRTTLRQVKHNLWLTYCHKVRLMHC